MPDRCNCHFSFWAIFCPFTLPFLTAQKIKISKNITSNWTKDVAVPEVSWEDVTHYLIDSYYLYREKVQAYKSLEAYDFVCGHVQSVITTLLKKTLF